MSSLPMLRRDITGRLVSSHTSTDGSELPVLYDPTGVALMPTERAPETDVVPLVVNDWQLDRFQEHFARNITPSRLANAHDQAAAGEPGLAEDLHEEMLEKDTRLGSLFMVRAAAALATPWDIVPAKSNDPEADEIRDEVEEILAETNFEELLSDLLLATAYGMSIAWQTWGLNDGVQVPVAFSRMRLKKFKWHPKRDELRLNTDNRSMEGEEIRPWTTVRATYLSRGEHPSRAGLMRPLSWLYLFKIYALQDYSLFVDRYGIPTRVVFIPRSDYLKTDMVARIRQSIRFLSADASGIFPDDSRIEIGKGVEGVPVHAGWLEDLHKMMAWGVVGHELSVQATQTGNYGVSAAKRVDEHFVRADCRMLKQTVERDVFAPIVGFNRGWDKRHLAPRFQHKWQDGPDQAQMLKNVAWLAKTFGDGFAFSRSQMRKIFGIAAPLDADDLEDDDVLLPAAVAAPSFGSANVGESDTPEAPEEEDQDEPPNLRRVASIMDSLRSEMEKLVPGQKNVDAMAERGMSDALGELTDWPEPIRRMVLRGAREGWSHERLRGQIAGLYLDLKTTKTQKTLAERMALARVYGLSTRPK